MNVLALQILTITSPKLSPAAQKIIEKEIYTVPILVYFLSFLNNPQALTPESIVHSKLLDVVRDNGIPLMIQVNYIFKYLYYNYFFYKLYFIVICIFIDFFVSFRLS